VSDSPPFGVQVPGVHFSGHKGRRIHNEQSCAFGDSWCFVTQNSSQGNKAQKSIRLLSRRIRNLLAVYSKTKS